MTILKAAKQEENEKISNVNKNFAIPQNQPNFT